MDSKKILLKYFLIFFLISFLIFNWQKISWIFHPGYVLRTVSFYLFEKGKTEKVQQKEEQKIKEQKTEEFYEKEDSIEIPKIKISAPLIVVGKEEEVKKALDRGVVLWPSSALPGEKGQVIILGHSAPPNWPKIKYDWVFSNLNSLEKGDEIFVYFKKKKYVYRVEEKIFLNRGQELPKTDPEKTILFLISCWPPGKDFRRIAIEASQIF
jgi:LPXTG-site transpeptidase (sortase) family protein